MFHITRHVIASLITLYQKTLSPDYGIPKVLFPYGFCPQHPTCSEYSKQTILEKGVILGLPLALKRVLGCHPWKKPSEERLREAAKRSLN